MLESQLNLVNTDAKNLIKDARAMFQAAAELTGEKAEEARNHGVRLLETALDKAQNLQACAVGAGKDMCASADGYVKENPWYSIAAAVGVGLLLGAIMSRKSSN